jgi:hypothetical protein
MGLTHPAGPNCERCKGAPRDFNAATANLAIATWDNYFHEVA